MHVRATCRAVVREENEQRVLAQPFRGEHFEKLRQPFVHRNNPTLVHKQLKTLRYAELKGRDWFERGQPVRMWMTPLVYFAAFAKDYVLRLAFLDGWRGWIISQVAASYAVYKRMRYYEMRRDPESRELAAEHLRRHGCVEVGNEVKAHLSYYDRVRQDVERRQKQSRLEVLKGQVNSMTNLEFSRAVERTITHWKWNSREG